MTSESERPSLRERRRVETHDAIRGAAFALAAERGVAAITVHDIAEAAGVSQRTFFNHFRCKEEALVPGFDPFPDDLVEAFLADPAEDLLSALEGLMSAYVRRRAGGSTLDAEDMRRRVRLIESNPELVPRKLAAFEEMHRRIAELVAQRIDADPDDVTCRVAATVAVAATRAALESSARHGRGRVDLAVVGTAFTAVRDLSRPSGRRTTRAPRGAK